MIIVWDERKRLGNLARHQMDFADLDEGFFGNAVFNSSHSGRWLAIGWSGDSVVSVVFARLGSEAISVISMRPASRKERMLLHG